MTRSDPAWGLANQRYLAASLRLLACRLAQRTGDERAAIERDFADAAEALPAPSAIDDLQTIFGLTGFERELVLLCAGCELDAELSERHGPPTFSLALSALAEPHWSALTPGRPLRHYRLIELQGHGPLVGSPLRIDERILHYLTGVDGLDARLDGILERVAPAGDLVPSHERIAAAITNAWQGDPPLPVIELWGPDADARSAIASAACERTGLRLHRLALDGGDRQLDDRQLARLITREAMLEGVALFADAERAEPGEAAALPALRRLVERVGAPVVLATRERGRRLQRPSIALEVKRPTLSEQRALWRDSLGAIHAASDAVSGVDRVVSQFDLAAPAIGAISRTVRSTPTGDLGDPLWDACRSHARTHIDELAQRVDAQVSWSDLVVPEAQRRTLREIGVRVRQRTRVYDTWGFSARGMRGLGLTALFAGPSGTGKTLAAEVLAADLRLDLYRVDLSQVVSKYIGETERNLARVFDAAESGAAILLFDEADALFGRRTEVKDSHDRYANIEIGYLLQRMEAYRGLAILTTNFRTALDQAFVRRLAFVVEFPMPDQALRGEIWRGMFPADAPTDALDFDQLARLTLSGGNIRNVALAAAFLAAENDEPVRMGHVFEAARGEYAKLERSVPPELTRIAAH